MYAQLFTTTRRLEVLEGKKYTAADVSKEDILGLALHMHACAEEHGWWPENKVTRNTPEALVLIHSEVSEALEEYRTGRPLDYIYPKNKPATHYDAGHAALNEKPEGFTVEMVDILIRILDTVEGMGLSTAFIKALAWKMTYNEARPYRHGDKRA
jgi:hypothetical protein